MFYGQIVVESDGTLFSLSMGKIFSFLGAKTLLAHACCVQGPPAAPQGATFTSRRQLDPLHQRENSQKKGHEMYLSIFFMHLCDIEIWVGNMQHLGHTPHALLNHLGRIEEKQPILEPAKPFSFLFLDFGDVHRFPAFLLKNKLHKTQEKNAEKFSSKKVVTCS